MTSKERESDRHGVQLNDQQRQPKVNQMQPKRAWHDIPGTDVLAQYPG